MIYLDYAATTPMSSQAIAVYTQTAKKVYGNTSSLHDVGGEAQHMLATARAMIAEKMCVTRDGVIFTGGGTEGNIIGILSLAYASNKKHIITTLAEHTSVHAALNILQHQGFTVTKLPLQKNGLLNEQLLEESITSQTGLCIIHHVNPEVGMIQPIERIATIMKRRAIFVHVDGVQSFAKLDYSSFATLVDSIAVSAHKVGGPKGCGALFINPTICPKPLVPGVTHEKGLRGGTIDVPSILAFVSAVQHFQYDSATFNMLREKMLTRLNKNYLLMQCQQQLPSICGIITNRYEGQHVMMQLNAKGIAISTGSACDIHNEDGTKTIHALGMSQYERQFIRISFGENTTLQEVETTINALNDIR